VLPVGLRKPFVFLHVNILREYLEEELRVDGAQVPTDLERALDDWIFMCFFVGNDFLPHLPSLEIREGAIESLIGIYKRRFNDMGGYITKDGYVDLRRVGILAEELGRMEDRVFQQRKEREDRYQDRNKRNQDMNNRHRAGPEDAFAVNNVPANASIVQQQRERREQNMKVAEALRNGGSANDEASKKRERPAEEPVEDDGDDVKLWQPGWKERFYQKKMGVELADTDFIRRLVKSYVEGLCWVLRYYYQGCPSWKWYYPYHYAPFASDLTNLEELDVQFELGQPFRPLEQLMAVLPAAR
jgi:5'-3' exoribonuclease 2